MDALKMPQHFAADCIQPSYVLDNRWGPEISARRVQVFHNSSQCVLQWCLGSVLDQVWMVLGIACSWSTKMVPVLKST